MSTSTLPVADSGCGRCKDGLQEPFPFTMAFQPIVNVETETVFAFEALARGPRNESAATVLGQVTEENKYAFDQFCRVKAITLAARLGIAEIGAKLSVNFMPGAVYSPKACIQMTLATAKTCGFPLDHLIFEITEGEKVLDPTHLANIVMEYQRHGFQMALDDFGAGYGGLNLFTDFAADILKLDMHLIRNLDQRRVSRAVVQSMVELCSNLGILLVAEGVETVEEYLTLRACGVSLMQGYLLAKPMFEGLPIVHLPVSTLQSSASMTEQVAFAPQQILGHTS